MTKKKRIITRLLVVLAALTLISCCFLGSTFARYTTSKEGSASVGVAKWAVTVTNQSVDSGTTNTSFGNLSPAITAYDATTPRTNKTARKLVATVVNNSDVSAEITLTLGELAVLDTAGSDVTDATVVANAKAVLSMSFSYALAETPANESDYKSLTSGTKLVMAGQNDTAPADSIAKGATVYIFAQVVWTSQDATKTEIESDAIDTSVGVNVASVKTTITYTAKQVTQIPAAA